MSTHALLVRGLVALRELGRRQDVLWRHYLDGLQPPYTEPPPSDDRDLTCSP